jgi:hypothetical protein
MKTKTAKTLPKTDLEIDNGGLYLQRVRCGKKNCKCAHGEKHLACYFFTRINGKLTKTYVRKSELLSFSEVVKEARERRVQNRLIFKSGNELIKQIRKQIKELEAFNKLSPDEMLSVLFSDENKEIK